MFDITKVNWKKVGIFASGVLFLLLQFVKWQEQLESKRFQARMLRTCTQIVQQQFFAQKTVL